MPEKIDFRMMATHGAKLKPRSPTINQVITTIKERHLHPEIEKRVIERAKKWPSNTLHLFEQKLVSYIYDAAAFMNSPK